MNVNTKSILTKLNRQQCKKEPQLGFVNAHCHLVHNSLPYLKKQNKTHLLLFRKLGL